MPKYVIMYSAGPYDGANSALMDKEPPDHPVLIEVGKFDDGFQKFARYDPTGRMGDGQVEFDGTKTDCEFREFKFYGYINGDELVKDNGI